MPDISYGPIDLCRKRSAALSCAFLGAVAVALVLAAVSAALLLGPPLGDYMRNATQRKPGSVVPWPKKLVPLGSAGPYDYLEIDRNRFRLKADDAVQSPVIDQAIERYHRSYLFDDRKPEAKDDPAAGRRRRLGALDELRLAPARDAFECGPVPGADMDESYTLTVSPPDAAAGKPLGSAQLTARSCWGMLRGLETLSQLVFNVAAPGGDAFGIQPVLVEDSPRFKHRGLMLDTSRHYISLSTILSIIDAMSFNKLNVFHWHMVDDQSWPYQSSTYPQLARRSAFRPDMTYSKQDVQLIVTYAAMRGIRVVPELDTPGHSYALRHIPGLLAKCYDWRTKQPNGDVGPIDPTSPVAYEVMDRFLAELGALFPDRHFHAGGDEVEFDCWKSNDNITSWMKGHHMANDYEQLSNYYMRKLYGLVQRRNKTMLVWQEVFDMAAELPKDTVIHVWKNINEPLAYMAELATVVDAGYPAILSSCWYLNYIDYGRDWIKFYKCDPRSAPVAEQDKHRVLGGEICMWTEYVDDTNVISRIWPRASAAAERLWSPKSVTDVRGFIGRLEQHRCRLTYRGVQAEPVNGPGYC